MRVGQIETIQIQRQYCEAKPAVASEDFFNPLINVIKKIAEASDKKDTEASKSHRDNTVNLII